MAFFRIVPNLIIMAPKDFKELENMLEYAIELKKPVVIRYPRGGEEYSFEKFEKLRVGKAETLKEGTDISLIGIGKSVARLNNIANILEEQGIFAEVINARFIKPFDTAKVKKSIVKTKNVITLEDGTSINGLGSIVKELIVENKLEVNMDKYYSYPDEFIPHGSCEELEKLYGVDEDSIYKYILNIFKKKEMVKINEKRRNVKRL